MATLFNNQYRIDTARLSDFDYGLEGDYFITICTKDRVCNLAEISEGKVIPSEIGHQVVKCWKEIPNHFSHVRLDEFVIMPNHLHGIISIVEPPPELTTDAGCRDVASLRLDKLDVAVQRLYKNESMGKISPKAGSIPTIIRSFKSICTREIRKHHTDFAWQSRYYDHIIRNKESFKAIQHYIYENPLKWEDDEDNPKNMRAS